MEFIESHIYNCSKIIPAIGEILIDKFGFREVDDYNKKLLHENFEVFDPDCFFVVEYPYVDRLHRDSYYRYYSSKLRDYHRNCCRISIFNGDLKREYFRDSEKLIYLQSIYKGFIVLRPLEGQIRGRSIISPTVLTERVKVCTIDYISTVLGLKLKVEGYPHSSQDGESFTCAETSVWSLMEYFGVRYADYKPALPSIISKVLSKYSVERLLPSSGLTPDQISLTLKKFGFGVRMYHKEPYGDLFRTIFSSYVESGIPIVGIIQNNGGIAHAFNVIGRMSDLYIDFSKVELKTLDNGEEYFDHGDIKRSYIHIDDNFPPYQIAPFDEPALYYPTDWHTCRFTSIIVPLHPRVYMEANTAIQRIKQFLSTISVSIIKPVVRVYLTSSRSLKNFLTHSNVVGVVKEIFLDISLPKFVWVGEISDHKGYLDNKSLALILLDATEPKSDPFIAAYIENKFLIKTNEMLESLRIETKYFDQFHNNLSINQ